MKIRNGQVWKSNYLRKAANSSGVTDLTARNPTSDEKHASVLPVCCPVRNVARANSAAGLTLPPLASRMACRPVLAAMGSAVELELFLTVARYTSSVHSETLPYISNSPQRFGRFSPAACVC